jgi:hypothetical protein
LDDGFGDVVDGGGGGGVVADFVHEEFDGDEEGVVSVVFEVGFEDLLEELEELE